MSGEKVFILFFLVWEFVNGGDIVLQCYQEYCLNDVVHMQCIASNGSIQLTWRIRDENDNSLSTQSYTTSDDLQSYKPLQMPADDFFTDLSSTSPSIISNISFTVQSSINGYTIQCSDNGGNIRNCPIIIADSPSSPESVNVSFSEEAITITWTVPTLCAVSYIINSNTTNSTITTTDTSVTIPLDGLSASIYCVSVAAVDITANRTGEYSEEECFELDVPPPPMMTITEATNGVVVVSLTFTPSSTIPPVTSVNIAFHSFNEDTPFNDVHPYEIGFQLEVMNLEGGIFHNVTAFGINAIGNGSATTSSIFINSTPSVVFVGPSITFTPPTNNSNSNNSGVIIAAVLVPIISLLIMALILVGVMIIVCTYCYTRSTKGSSYSVQQQTADQIQMLPAHKQETAKANQLQKDEVRIEVKPEHQGNDEEEMKINPNVKTEANSSEIIIELEHEHKKPGFRKTESTVQASKTPVTSLPVIDYPDSDDDESSKALGISDKTNKQGSPVTEHMSKHKKV